MRVAKLRFELLEISDFEQERADGIRDFLRLEARAITVFWNGGHWVAESFRRGGKGRGRSAFFTRSVNAAVLLPW